VPEVKSLHRRRSLCVEVLGATFVAGCGNSLQGSTSSKGIDASAEVCPPDYLCIPIGSLTDASDRAASPGHGGTGQVDGMVQPTELDGGANSIGQSGNPDSGVTAGSPSIRFQPVDPDGSAFVWHDGGTFDGGSFVVQAIGLTSWRASSTHDA
jgi:hypothetical protein